VSKSAEDSERTPMQCLGTATGRHILSGFLALGKIRQVHWHQPKISSYQNRKIKTRQKERKKKPHHPIPHFKFSVLKNKGMYILNSFKTETFKQGLQKYKITEEVV